MLVFANGDVNALPNTLFFRLLFNFNFLSSFGLRIRFAGADVGGESHLLSAH